MLIVIFTEHSLVDPTPRFPVTEPARCGLLKLKLLCFRRLEYSVLKIWKNLTVVGDDKAAFQIYKCFTNMNKKKIPAKRSIL
jgi:hypothetical protein